MDYDVIIVGARVAGSTLAALLGSRGWKVLLLDKASFPSDTLSTHFFRAPALSVFEQLGVLDQVTSAAPPLRIMWNYIDGHVISEPVQAERPLLNFFLCERRLTLDWILLQRVMREPTVEVRQGANVRDLLREGDRVTGVTWIESGAKKDARARIVVGADGFYSTVTGAVKPASETSYPVQRCMYYTYFSGLYSLEQPTAEHHFVGDSLTYVFPTDANLTLVALSLPITEYSTFKKDPAANLMAYLKSLPLLASRLEKAEIAAEVKGAGNIPGYQRIPFGPGWALVGDSQQIMDPWSGMGIDHTTTHASILAEELDFYLREQKPWDTSLGDYHRRARMWSEKSYRRTCTFAADLRPMTKAALQKRGLS